MRTFTIGVYTYIYDDEVWTRTNTPWQRLDGSWVSGTYTTQSLPEDAYPDSVMFWFINHIDQSNLAGDNHEN